MSNKANNRDGERGTALIFALMFTTVVVGIVLTGTLTLKSQIAHNRTLFITNYQAVMTARSGLTEALSWLRRQTAQPVTAFEPVLDTVANPPILDTEDADIGLVRDFRISGNLWARYEVWKEWDSDPDPTRLAWRQQFQCKDISAAKSGANAGTAWRLRSVGYVYRQLDSNIAFNLTPNIVLATELAETDVLRSVINLPGEAAVNVSTGGNCYINSGGRVLGGAATGIYYPQSTGTPSAGTIGDRVSGSPWMARAITYDDSYEAVFGLTFSELSSLADQLITSSSNFPSPVPDNTLIVADLSSMTFTSSTPLEGSGIVVINGDVTIQTGSYSLFSGMLYVDGNLTMLDPSEINGAVVCTGTLTVAGGGDFATINYDGTVMTTLMNVLGNYRQSSSLSLPRRSN